ncbi:hypothetical protein WM2015_138 [Wenzhouxiangella marina]|uniref:Uncharacterized protein n=1 Tax=Wenzhouxiangella marina TaxID=1579979 RepID=A0A0K0XSD1_9GAMM|nr:hypothetical protein WM2015_138 [Wenzhouxiangella marina]
MLPDLIPILCWLLEQTSHHAPWVWPLPGVIVLRWFGK